MSYFRAATPFSEIASLNIGSRPASRKPSQKLEDLRAIPWVFSWSQSRAMIPGWYGFGAAVREWREPQRHAGELREMHERWPFFRAMLSNLDMVLAKTDLGIAGRDPCRAGRASDLGKSVFERIESEWHASRGAALRHHRRERISRRQPHARAVHPQPLRYLDRLNHIQVELLRRYRGGDPRAHGARHPPHDQRHRRRAAK